MNGTERDSHHTAEADSHVASHAGRPPGPPPDAHPGPGSPRPERRLFGIPICPGIAIGPVFRTVEPAPQIARTKIQASDIQAEGTRLDAAVAQSRKQLGKLRARLALLPEDSQGEIAPLLDAYIQMLGPSRLLRGARRRIAERLVSAETAVTEEAQAIGAALLARDDESGGAGRRQADEVREIGRRIVRNLTRAPFRNFKDAPHGAVLVTEGLRPADAAVIDPARIAGVAADEGGADGHTAIMLRALGVPAVLGVPGLSDSLTSGVLAVIDGAAGTVTLDPSPASLLEARRGVAAFARERQHLGRLRRLPAETLDGEAAELQANLELPAELPMIARAGAQGIGLLRTEFLFMNRETVPGEDEQAETYRAVVEAMAGDPVTIRVLDWGGEKEIEALANAGLVPEVADVNPALGLRGVRLLLRQPGLFETQLAAILRASSAGPVRVMLPMVTHLSEVRQTRATYRAVADRLRARGVRLPERLPPLGIMVETPGAALSADAMAGEAEFFAIGTNDLCMYTLAVDRGETEVAALYDPLHPAVLRLVQFTVEAALRHRIPVSVCGEMAGDPRLTPLLLGLGVRSFSMNASALPRVKQAVRGTSIEGCIRLAWRVMRMGDPAAIRDAVAGFAG